MVGGSNLVGILFLEFQSLQEEDKESAYRGDRMEKMTNADEKHAKQIFLWMVEGNTLVFPSDIWIYYDRKIRWEVTDTRMKPFNDSLVMNVWGDMKQLRRRMTIRLVVRILLYKSLQLLEMNERFNSGDEKGELLVSVRDTFVS